MARCIFKVPNRLPYLAPPTQCERQAVEGSEFCWQHDPVRRTRKKQEQDRKIDIRILRRSHSYSLAEIGRAYLAGDAEALANAVAECRRVEAELKSLGETP